MLDAVGSVLIREGRTVLFDCGAMSGRRAAGRIRAFEPSRSEESALAGLDHGPGIRGDDGGIDVAGEVAEGDHPVAVVGEVLDVRLEQGRRRVDPGVSRVGDAVELDDGDLAVSGLRDGSLEVLERPAGTGVARRGNEQGVVEARLVGESSAFVVGIFGRSASPGELDPCAAKDGQDVLIQDVAGVGEGDWAGECRGPGSGR